MTICCRRPLQRTRRVPAHLSTIPEEESIRFFLHDSSIRSQHHQKLQLQIFPGLLERDFENDEDLRLVNRSRVVRNIDPLRKSQALDALAQAHAECMAQEQLVHHSVNVVDQLQKKLDSREVGENVQRGESVWQIHHDLVRAGTDSFLFNNMISTTYNEMGCGKAHGKDGLVYWVQLFRSTEEAEIEE
jgi:uncharacterized protein YkwD